MEPSSASWVADRLTAASRSRASARSRQPLTWTVPAVSTRSVSTSNRRPSAARRRRSSASAGSWRARASSTSRPIWAHEHVPAAGASARVDLGGRGHRQAGGVLGDPHRPPHRHPPGHHLLPEPRQAVAELEGLADVGLAGVGGQAQRGGVLHECELRHQRRSRPGDRHGPVAEEADLVRGPLPVGLDGVLDRPLARSARACGSRPAAMSALAAQLTEEGLGGGRRCFGHGSIAAGATDSRTPKSGLCTGVGESSWVKFSRSTAGVLSLRRWLRCERSEPRNHPARHARRTRFRGSGLAALTPQPARGSLLLLGVRGLATVGPGGPPYSTSEVVRWLRCERSEPRNHPHRQPGFVARA